MGLRSAGSSNLGGGGVVEAEMWHQLGLLLFCFLCISAGIFSPANGYTNPDDVSALNNMFSTLNSNSQLNGWTSNNGDPCGQTWRGVTCSGSAVTEIHLTGLGLTGYLEGYMLEKMTSLSFLDLSNNNIGVNKELPYSFPPNLQHLDLSRNSYTGTLPWTISKMSHLEYLSISKNQLSGGLNDMFGNLYSLSTIDLSGNSLSGNLPGSFINLSKLNALYLQNNKLTGTINVLAYLPLQNLNIENNQFNGWIPTQLKGLRNLKSAGNSWSSGLAPPSPPGRKISPGNNNSSDGGGGSKSGISGGGIAGIIITLLVVGSIVAFFLIRRRSTRFLINRKQEDQSHAPLASSEINEMKSITNILDSTTMTSQSPPHRTLVMQPPTPLIVKPPPADKNKSYDEKVGMPFKSPPKKTNKIPVNATAYSIADLQVATGSFSIDNLLGEGTLGRVYRAQFSDGKIIAVKKINSSIFSSHSPGDFMEVVSNISRLHHPNVTELVGYCSEHGQHLLVYEFHRNGSLYDFLYISDDYSKPLTWNTRVKISLGTARALEYLHEVCLPSIIHKNFKSANILLDAELNPHLSDCGLSNLITSVEDQALDQYMGSGYCAPEVAMSGQYTLKSDVFSFGVVMLELLTGRMPFDSTRARSEQSLVRWATPQLHDIDALDKMVDPALKGLYPAKSLSRFADIISICVQTEPEFRPPMSDIVQALVRLVQRANMNKRVGSLDEQEALRHEADMQDML